MTPLTQTIALRSALAVYAQELDRMHSVADPTIALAVARVSNRKLAETLAMSEAKQEGFEELGQRIIDLTTELKEVK